MQIQEWIDKNNPADDLIYKAAFWSQVMFLRDGLAHLAGAGLTSKDRYERKFVKVISTHTSKSVTLPVVEYTRKDLGLRLIVRNNFYNWKISVISEDWIDDNVEGKSFSLFEGLFFESPPREPEYTGNCLSPVYFEGFPSDLIFGYYSENKAKWSAEIGGDHAMWTTIFIIMRRLGAIKPLLQMTREEHKKQLAEE